jgi:hypothetical protein
MFVIKHKTKDQFLYKGTHEVSLRDIDSCTTYKTEGAAKISLGSHKTKFYLQHNHGEKPENFEIRPVKLTLI